MSTLSVMSSSNEKNSLKSWSIGNKLNLTNVHVNDSKTTPPY